MFIVQPPGIQYEGETFEQMCERDRKVAEHNAMVQRELDAWRPAPMRGLEEWCRKHCPDLLNPGGLERLRKGARA